MREEKSLLHYPRKARENNGGQGSWLFWFFVITTFAAIMRMASIISTDLNGNISRGHKSLWTIQSTHARTIRVFEICNNGLLPNLLTLTNYTIDCGAVDTAAISFSYAFSMVDSLIIIKSSIYWLLRLYKCVRRTLSPGEVIIVVKLSGSWAIHRRLTRQKSVFVRINKDGKSPLLQISNARIVQACIDCIV